MKKVKIYLRSISSDKEHKLSLFDSNGNGGINELETVVFAGDEVVWKTDYKSGIKEITKIYSKEGKKNVFKKITKKNKKGFSLKIPKDAKGKEAYGIDYLTKDGKEIKIDPVLKIKPPPQENGDDN